MQNAMINRIRILTLSSEKSMLCRNIEKASLILGTSKRTPNLFGEGIESGVAHTTLSAKTGVGVPNFGLCFNDGYSQVPSLPTPGSWFSSPRLSVSTIR
jgi:hypothetical protein